MRLSKWLQETGTTQEAFGLKIGLTQGRVSQICINGTNSIATAVLIERETGQQVTIREVMKMEAAE